MSRKSQTSDKGFVSLSQKKRLLEHQGGNPRKMVKENKPTTSSPILKLSGTPRSVDYVSYINPLALKLFGQILVLPSLLTELTVGSSWL